MVMSPGFPEYLYGQDGRREVLLEAGALSIDWHGSAEMEGKW